MDIGGFFMSYCKMLTMGLRYHQIIKIHSKTNKKWRYAMLYSILGSDKIVANNLKLMENINNGMIGHDKIPVSGVFNVNKKSSKDLNEYLNFFKIKK